MAVVLRARDEALGRLVALKVLTPALADDMEFRERFMRESRAAAAVDHPHIIPVYGAGETEGVLYIAMRYVSGGDLRALITREGPLPADRAAFLLAPVASALDAGHAAGLVHRDVKPANILIDAGPGRADHPYLADFGLAKGSASSIGLTGTGQFLGSLEYCAPEQIGGKRAVPQTDQYALGCVAYTMLTGTVPFPREEATAVMWAHMSESPPAVTDLRPDLAQAVDDVIARALAKPVEDRYVTCGEFIDALRAALEIGPYPFPGTIARASRAKSGPAPLPLAEDSATASASQPVPRIRNPENRPVQLPHAPTEFAAGAESRHRQRGTALQNLSRRMVVIISGAALLVLTAAGVSGFWVYDQSQYFVAVQENHVEIFRGINSKFAGISLYNLISRTTLLASQLPHTTQATLDQTIPEGSLSDATKLVSQLQAEAEQ